MYFFAKNGASAHVSYIKINVIGKINIVIACKYFYSKIFLAFYSINTVIE